MESKMEDIQFKSSVLAKNIESEMKKNRDLVDLISLLENK